MENEQNSNDADGNEANSSESATDPTLKSTRTSHRYSEQDDISILKEVLVEKAFGKCPGKWILIHSRVGIRVKDGLALKRRFDLLLQHFKAENAKSLKASGTDEEHTEKIKLLQDIVDLMETDILDLPETQRKSKVQKKQDDDLQQAKVLREAALETCGVEEENTTPKRVRAKPDDFMGYLMESEKKKADFKTMTLDMEKKRLELLEREVKVKEDNEVHRRDMERRKLDLEEKKMLMDQQKAEREAEEKSLLFQLLRRQL